MDKTRSIACLSANALKWIAALSMLLDHIGVILLPEVLWLRAVGRLAFPLFSFMIAQGCRYTRHRGRYFACVFGLGGICYAVRLIYDGTLVLNSVVMFSLSILMIYALQYWKQQAVCGTVLCRAAASLMLLASVFVVVALGCLLPMDYGIGGCMLPLLAAIPHPAARAPLSPRAEQRVRLLSVLLLSLGTLALSVGYGGVQYFSLLTVPLLLLYSGKRGRYGCKYFFYIFYPTHILLLQALAWLLG